MGWGKLRGFPTNFSVDPCSYLAAYILWNEFAITSQAAVFMCEK
jgi:hypothetical protein